ncbi:MAG: protease inhibitor I42 family protein [Gaiellaceae bacterium]
MEDLPAELTLHVGERRRFRLPGLAQAGYRWRASIESGADAVDVETSFDDAGPGDTVPGRPFAAEVLSIVARAPGRAKVRLGQARSWETETGAIAERRLAITVVDRAP